MAALLSVAGKLKVRVDCAVSGGRKPARSEHSNTNGPYKHSAWGGGVGGRREKKNAKYDTEPFM